MSTKKSILISRNTGGIGDLLMLTPVFRAVKQSFPKTPVIVCTTDEYGQNGTILFNILQNNPHIDYVITSKELLNFKFKKFYNFNTRIEVDVEKNFKKYGLVHRTDIFLNVANLKINNKRPVYLITDEEKKWAETWIESNVDKNRRVLIGIQVDSSSKRRSWSSEKSLLLSFLITNCWKDVSVLLFYEDVNENSSLKSYENIYNLVGLPIRYVASLIDRCEAMVTVDSGLLHLSGALKKKGLALFGPTPEKSRIKYYPEIQSINLNYPCSPCWDRHCNNEIACLRNIEVNHVFDRLSVLLGRSETTRGKNILIIRMGGIGDLIMLTPSIRQLKENNSDSIITLATLPKHLDVLHGLKYIDNIISISDISKYKFDSVYDLRYKVESPEVGGTLSSVLYRTENRIDTFARLLGVSLKNRQPDIFLDKELKLPIKIDRKFKWLGIQVSCVSNIRTIPPAYIKEVCDKLKEFKNLKIVFIGRTEYWHGRKSIDFKTIQGNNIINLVDENFELSYLISLINEMDYVIAPDSSIVHIAGALKKRCLAIYGPMLPELRLKYYKTVKCLFSKTKLDCFPCCFDTINPCLYYKEKTEDQPIGGKCMWLIKPDKIVTKVVKEMGL
jgi:ADP-heptose:LPS heptosyltransferase